MQDGKRVILCVDDDPDFLDVLQMILESNGYVMVQAASAEEALKVFRQTDPDVLLVDLMMEEVDAGTSLVRELKAMGNQAPIYMLSSVGDSLAVSTDCSELGLAGVFQKPVDSAALLTILRAKLRARDVAGTCGRPSEG
ncbi:hypothetical protein LCGC14_2016460 [marine sediment metagenome]|uniref:Response regulatory domain-containing protein n=1 Tax=marine sediment metagenome TaxID=412755 RepID=A0A0F9FLC8_9ZZZZ